MLRLSLCLGLLASCHASVHQSGWVNSPGYPHGYGPFAKQEWSRCAPKAHELSLTLTHLDMEDSYDCENDALEIYSDGQKIVSLCGKKSFEELHSSVNPLLQSSAGGCLSLVFRSDYSNTERHTGFRGFYSVNDFDECKNPSDTQKCSHFCHNFIGGYYCSCRYGYVLHTDQHTCTVSCSMDLSGSTKGRISSPSRPYPENSRCRYTLSVEPHLQLELEFSADFDLEESDGQCRDSLTVETPSGTLGPFCGQVAPRPLLTHSNHIIIHFNSDEYGSNNGFTLFYRTKAQSCSGTVTPNSTIASKVMRQAYHHGDKVTVTCDTGYEADTPEELTSHYETTCQKTGRWSPLYSCDLLNCDLPDISAQDLLQLVDKNPSTSFGDQIQFRCSSPYYTLEGHDRFTCDARGAWVSMDGREALPRCQEVCGNTANEILSTSRILGGVLAKLGEIPWQLAVKGRMPGGASLIGDRWVLTAAHVVDNNPNFQLYGGLVNLAPSKGQPLPWDTVIIHPGFQKNVANNIRTNFDNDIALVRLASRAPLGPNLSPICLPESQGALPADLMGSVAGWGMTESMEKSQILRHAPISVYGPSTCRSTPQLSKNLPMVFTENMFCAGYTGRDSCSRDSGGPFFVPRLGDGNQGGRGPYRIEGIVSWGPDCRKPQFKGYYTAVRNYVGWIRETIKKLEDE